MKVRFEYLRPSSIEEAIELLQKYGNRAMLIAGGTDVMVGIRQNKFSPQVLISLKGVKGFDSIETYKDGLRIGALSTHSQLAESVLIRKSFTALADAVDHLGSLQIRNVATIGGNISNALPSADTACPLLVLDAQVKIKGPQGERNLPLSEFFMGQERQHFAQIRFCLNLISLHFLQIQGVPIGRLLVDKLWNCQS
jgi:CO/xanthine dehydrogenase FAD-binding subunit